MIPRVAGLSREQRTEAQDIAVAELTGQQQRIAGVHDAGALRARPTLRPRLWQTGCRPSCLGQALTGSRSGRPRSRSRAACALSACGVFRGGTPDNEPTLKTLANRKVTVDKEDVVAVNEEKAIEAYRKFLDIAPAAPQRSEAMRRIGDLEMDSADSDSLNRTEGFAHGGTPVGGAAPDYKAAVARYQEYLKNYPTDPNNDRVLYQMARAYEQSGDLESAQKTLARLVKDYPATRYAGEAQFRRGELLFTNKDYAGAEKAFETVLASPDANPYRDRSLYMLGWSQYKQGRLEDGLKSFLGVLDIKVAGKEGETGLDAIAGLTRAERELIEDTFRVASISFANLQGAESIPPFMTTPTRKTYEFRVYEQLAELYIKQERPKDAADTFNLFARRNPLHAAAPVMQARVIEIYEKSGFINQAIEARKEYIARYGRTSEFRRINADGWDKAQPLVKSRLAELARHYHATAQKTKSSADSQEAVRWYREYLASFPSDPAAAQSNFLLAELLFEDSRFAEASVEYEKVAYGYPKHEKSADAGYGALLGYAALLKKAPPAEQPALQRSTVASALRFAQTFPTDTRNGLGPHRRGREALRAEGDRPGRRGRAARGRAQAAGGRRAAPRRLDRDRLRVVRQERLRRRREGVRRGDQADAGEGSRRVPTWSSARRRRSTSRPRSRARAASTRKRRRASPASARSRRRARRSAPTRSTTPRRR